MRSRGLTYESLSMLRVLTSSFGYVCLLIFLVLLAYWRPAIGSKGGWLNPPFMTDLLVVLIFFVQGGRLNLDNLVNIFRRPVSSFALQAGIIFLPVLWVKIFWSLAVISETLYGPLFFAAILPTTVSSCVVYTSKAKGNADYSLGHATLSNLSALVVVPLLWAGSYENSGAFEVLLPKISLLVLVPCLIGWLLSKCFARLAQVMNMEWGRQLPMLCIAWLVFLTMCDGIDMIGEDLFLPKIITVLPYALGFVILVHLSGWFFSKRWARKKDIQVAQFFCLSQKSLATGLPIATILFSDNAEWVMQMILPLFCIHFLQLLVGSLLMSVFKIANELDDSS